MEDTKNELGYIRNMLKLLDTRDLVAIVGDSYNIFHFCELVGSIKDEVIEKTQNGKFLVIRPDSGDPIEVLPKMMTILEHYYGAPKNAKGYKVLNNVRVIWGDGINAQSLETILRTMVDFHGYSADNFAFGMGGGLLQQLNRDTQQWAMKCSAVGIREYETTPVEGTADEFWKDGCGPNIGSVVWRDVYKDPVTDSGKKSKRGRVTLWKCGSEYESSVEWPTNWTDKGFGWDLAMYTYFEDGEIKFTQTFDQVRANSML